MIARIGVSEACTVQARRDGTYIAGEEPACACGRARMALSAKSYGMGRGAWRARRNEAPGGGEKEALTCYEDSLCH